MSVSPRGALYDGLKYKGHILNTSLPEKKLLDLEILRFISAMAILVFHYHQFAYVGHMLLLSYQTGY
jgi:hypothetical protein